MKNHLTIGLVQHTCNANRDENLQRSFAGIEQAVKQGAQVVLLSELHTGLYFCQTENHHYFDLAESIPGPTTEQLSALAKKLHVVIIASLFERRAAGLYHNTAVVLEKNGDIAGIYRKMHIPDDPGYYEKFYFTPGDLGFQPIQTSAGKLGILVCWDQWYPEAARLMALAGADALFYPTAIGWVPEDNQDEQQRQRDAWITIQRSHAIANGIPVVVANRHGLEKENQDTNAHIQFWGSSFIAGPQGELLAQASTDKDEVIVATIDKNRTEQVRRLWPYLRDRRIDAYADIQKRYIG